MRKISLALVLAFSSLAGMAHAANGPVSSARPMSSAKPVSSARPIVAPTTAALKQYIAAATPKAIKPSSSANSVYQKVTVALASSPSAFRALKIGKQGPDFGETAYIPKVYIKGVAGNTAYIMSESIAGPRLTGKVQLPLF